MADPRPGAGSRSSGGRHHHAEGGGDHACAQSRPSRSTCAGVMSSQHTKTICRVVEDAARGAWRGSRGPVASAAWAIWGLLQFDANKIVTRAKVRPWSELHKHSDHYAAAALACANLCFARSGRSITPKIPPRSTTNRLTNLQEAIGVAPGRPVEDHIRRQAHLAKDYHETAVRPGADRIAGSSVGPGMGQRRQRLLDVIASTLAPITISFDATANSAKTPEGRAKGNR